MGQGSGLQRGGLDRGGRSGGERQHRGQPDHGVQVPRWPGQALQDDRGQPRDRAYQHPGQADPPGRHPELKILAA